MTIKQEKKLFKFIALTYIWVIALGVIAIIATMLIENL